jgi:ABC-2 type transport system ATP-binding protein
MIRTESLTKYFGTRPAVRDLSFRIEDTEVVGFLGLNGAGKTTTLRMLAGLLAPSNGTIEIDSEPLHAERSIAVRRRIGFLPERPPLYDEMGVQEFLEFAARLRGVREDRAGAAASEAMEQTGLGDHRHQGIGSLSHGYRQRVGIAQAIVHRPSLVILDEPTSGLDPVQIAHMRELIRELRGRHTILVSSHNLPEIQQTCDRLLVIRDGRLVASGTEAELWGRSRGRVRLELVGEPERIRELLPDDSRIRPTPASEANTLEVEATLTGPTEELVERLVGASIGVRRVEPVTEGLEELFVQLTTEEAQ